MARRRFFVSEIRRGIAELTGADAEHLVRVLRAEVGQVYELSDNQNVYLATVETARKSLVSFRVTEKLEEPAASVYLTVVPALIKFDRFEVLVEKATELGVNVIQPFEATRTEHGLAQAAVKRLARWEKIAVEASQQSRRGHLPRVEKPVRFAQALETEAPLRLFLDEDVAPPIGTQLPAERSAADRVALLSGPEGGWTEEERMAARAAGWQPCSLGRMILRSETAAIAGLAVIQAAWSQPRHAPDCSPLAAS
jgi:16S rRNA (uracil1498-N3)-methyltransferase